MARYPSAWLDELRMRADIVQIVSSYVPLKKSGRRYTGLCPFHNEKTPSFSVDAQKQLYYCFGCKAGGSVIQFVMDIEHMRLPGSGQVPGRTAAHAAAGNEKRPRL